LRSAGVRAMLGAIVTAGATASAPAVAATATTTFNVSAAVQATCLMSASNLGFGSYSGSAVATSTTLSVTCTNGTSYNIGLNAGTAAGATVTTRAMTGPGGATLSYALYQDSGHATNWGNTVGTDTKSGSGNGSAQTLTVYGNLAGNQYPTPGGYSDTITATITY
jgi:spore coat protein U domain-containing protein, fimbrial subunit CupE1/2/3/6